LREAQKKIISIDQHVDLLLKNYNLFIQALRYLYQDYKACAKMARITKLRRRFDFEVLSKQAEKETDLIKRKEIFDNAYFESEMNKLKYPLSEVQEKKQYEYSQNCHRAAKLVSFLIERQANIVAPVGVAKEVVEEITKSESTADFTTKRQVMAIYYLLNEFSDYTNQVDRTQKARFIEFITGKNYDSIYKALSNPLKGLDAQNPTNTLKDLSYVKTHFTNMGLTQIASKIENDLKA
jgi:hypothetical protein